MYGINSITSIKSQSKETGDSNNGSKDSSSLGTEGSINCSCVNNADGDRSKPKMCEK